MTGTIRVLVVGPKYPSRNSRGGMATVVGLMRDRHDPRAEVVTVATYVDDGAAIRLATAVLGTLRAVTLILTRRVDLVHVHLAHKGSVTRKSLPLWAARLCGVPSVIHAHSFDFAGWFDTLPGWARLVVRRALPARRWLILGNGLVGEYQDRMGLSADVTRVLHNPAPAVGPPREGNDGSAPGDVLAVCLGRLGHRKGTYDLLAALDLLDTPTRTALHVVLAGDGELDEVCEEIARRGLEDVVEARHWLASSERDALLSTAQLFILPSHAEGMPMAMLEAMAAGLVPLVTAVGAVGEIAHDGNAVLVEPGNPAALAEAIERLVLNPELRQKLATGAQETAAALTIDDWFDQIVDVWTSLLNDDAAPVLPPPR